MMSLIKLTSVHPLSHKATHLNTNFGFTVKLVVHRLVNPLSDARQPLLEAHYHHPLIHGLSTALANKKNQQKMT